MLCPRCGKPVPPGAAFCPACGSPVTPTSLRPPAPASARPASPPRPATAPPAPNATVAADFDAQRRRNRLAMAGVGVAAILAAFFGARALGLLRLGASSPKPGLQVRADVPQPALQLPGKVAPAPLKQEGSRVVMPDNIRDWLEHLRRCDLDKGKLTDELMAKANEIPAKVLAAQATAASSDDVRSPEKVGAELVSELSPKWQALITKFNSYPPPSECVDIASNYGRALAEIPGEIKDLADIIDGSQADTTSAQLGAKKVGDANVSEIDDFFVKADRGVTDVCARYETKKWFNIDAHGRANSPLSMPMLGGGGLPSGLGGVGGLSGMGQ